MNIGPKLFILSFTSVRPHNLPCLVFNEHTIGNWLWFTAAYWYKDVCYTWSFYFKKNVDGCPCITSLLTDWNNLKPSWPSWSDPAGKPTGRHHNLLSTIKMHLHQDKRNKRNTMVLILFDWPMFWEMYWWIMHSSEFLNGSKYNNNQNKNNNKQKNINKNHN